MELPGFLEGFSPRRQHTTARGERVKSRAEKQIADYLARSGIAYVYHRGAQDDEPVPSQAAAKPDFFLPDYDVYVEYWDLAHTDERHVNSMKSRMTRYQQSGIRFISLYPGSMQDLDSAFRTKFKQVVGFDPSRGGAVTRTGSCPSCGAPPIPGAVFCGYCGTRLA